MVKYSFYENESVIRTHMIDRTKRGLAFLRRTKAEKILDVACGDEKLSTEIRKLMHASSEF